MSGTAVGNCGIPMNKTKQLPSLRLSLHTVPGTRKKGLEGRYFVNEFFKEVFKHI